MVIIKTVDMGIEAVNNMAATVDLGQQLQIENVSHLPPRGPSSSGRPWSGCFHNRGRLFSTLKQQSACDADSAFKHPPSPTRNAPTPPSPADRGNNGQPSLRHRRVQSAKARLEVSHASQTNTKDATVARTGSDLAVFDVNMNLNLAPKPFRRNSRTHTKDSKPFLHEVSGDRSASRPSSAKACRNLAWTPGPSVTDSESEEREKETDDSLKPSVYGYRLKRQVFGSNPDIFTAGVQSSPDSTMFKLDETHVPASQLQQKLKENHTASGQSRTIPRHMEPLRPWLTHTVPQEVIGIDPSTCLVFLPLNQTFDNLPVVPLQ